LGTGPRKGDKEFFNFCKSVVGSLDKDAAAEMYSAEALCRYISGMFYALLFALVAILMALVFIHIARLVLAILLVVYAVAFAAILANYRFLRIKEVKTVFSVAFCKRDSLEKLFSLTQRVPGQ
jgi:type IV secretory pathway VirB3-like protein